MKVKNITDVEKFFKVIDECKGKVELVTDEGDRLNLKSKLTQYVAPVSYTHLDVYKRQVYGAEPGRFRYHGAVSSGYSGGGAVGAGRGTSGGGRIKRNRVFPKQRGERD